MFPKRILNVDLPYLPKCTDFLLFQKVRTCFKFQANRFFYRGGLTGKLQPNRFLKFRFLVASRTRGFFVSSPLSSPLGSEKRRLYQQATTVHVSAQLISLVVLFLGAVEFILCFLSCYQAKPASSPLTRVENEDKIEENAFPVPEPTRTDEVRLTLVSCMNTHHSLCTPYTVNCSL